MMQKHINEKSSLGSFYLFIFIYFECAQKVFHAPFELSDMAIFHPSTSTEVSESAMGSKLLNDVAQWTQEHYVHWR